ncbi:fungal-specific transcription factor domain-containing protein [Xylaria palmicola]|nr:fungal-specific transcription factor domain-containing protein [Xylaria palmicola]
MAGTSIKAAGDGSGIDISNQENVSRRAGAGTSGRGSKPHIRHRASIACFSCRDRRIRCVVPKGGSGCTQCKRSGTECVIKMDDERRRPISKAYVSSLSARIAMLEGMLRERGIAVPPATHPPMTKQEAQSAGSGDEIRVSVIEARRHSKSDASSPIRHILSPPYSHEDFAMYESPGEDLVSTDMLPSREEPLLKEQSTLRTLDARHEESMQRLLFPGGGLSCDRISGRIRYFGPTANCHVHAAPPSKIDARQSPEQTRRAERIIRSLAPKTHDYLMQNFWKYHNSVLQVVDKTAFEADMDSENPKFYSSFLHIIILAIGWRFASKDRYDTARMNLGNHESTIHREARYMLDTELERPMGLPSIQSLLLLGDLECGVGRDRTGWMYAGMANRLAFHMGLHVDCRNIGLSEREMSVRHRVMRACFLYDRYWALFLGRPTSIKRQYVDWSVPKTAAPTTHLPGYNAAAMSNTQAIEEEIHQQLIELMDIAGRVVDSRSETRPGHNTNQPLSTGLDEGTAIDMSTLNQQLRDWHGRLPSHLTWGVDNARTAPHGYFLFHEQYYAITILLHRSQEPHGSRFKGTPESPSSSDARETAGLSFTTQPALGVCTHAATQLAQIIAQSKQNYDLKDTCCTSLQPAGTAAIALLAAIMYGQDETERRLHLSSLEVVSDAIRVMSRSYQPAAKMETLIQSILAQLHLHPDMRSEPWGYSHSPGQDANSGKDGQGLRSEETDIFPPPTRRDGEEFVPSNKRSGTTGPESTKPPPSFHMPPSPSCYQVPLGHGHHLSFMPGILSTFPELPDTSLYLDSFYTPNVGVDGMYASRHSSDNYLRVAPSAKGWGLQSLHAASQPEQPTPDFDSHMPDWLGEPAAGFGGAAALHEPKFDGQAALSAGLGTGLDAEGLPVCKREDTGGMMWINSDGGLTPVTPGGFMQQEAEKAADLRNHEGKGATTARPRNHELDYLSL